LNHVGYVTGRYVHAFDVCDRHGLRRPRIFISECAWKYSDAAAVSIGMTHDIPQLAAYYAQHPEVLGCALWYLGGAFGDVANQVQPYIEPITKYALSAEFSGVPTWGDGAPHYQGAIDPPKPEPIMDIKEIAITVADAHPSKVGVIEQSALPALEASIRAAGEIAASSEIDFKVGADAYKVKIGRKAEAVTDADDTYHVVKVPHWNDVQRLKKA
jgi:hypothetical protein